MLVKPAYLVLANGKVLKGKSFGAEGTAVAEVVFTTAMAGYLETLTDDSYFGQAVVQAFPLIGSYDDIAEDVWNKSVSMSAYIVRRWCHDPSKESAPRSLDAFLKAKGVVGICDIDTRALVRIIREEGVMNAMITTEYSENFDFDKIRSYKIENAVKSVSVKEPVLKKAEKAEKTVVMLDLGETENAVNKLNERGCDVWVMPYNTSAAEILAKKPDGIVLSAGAGDPGESEEAIATVKELVKAGVPMLGISLGHQIMALAHGFATFKMKYGHRSANQPVRHTESGKIYITLQNHGYAVDGASIDPLIAKQLFNNVNDLTCEGIEYKNIPAFSVQFDPATASGPKETSFVFDDFVSMMNK